MLNRIRVLGLLVLAACTAAPTASTDSSDLQKRLPVISSFTATPASLTAGQSSTLTWVVGRATSLSIDQGVGTVSGASVSVTPAATTTYTLTATNAYGSVTAKATITVSSVAATAPPVIASFTSSMVLAPASSAVTLSWSVTGAASLSIDQGVGAVTGTSATVTPAASTTYILTAANSAGSVHAPCTVTVAPAAPAPYVVSFTANPLLARPGQQVTLSWSVSNATSVSIDNGGGSSSSASGSVIVTPSVTTTYTLNASGATATQTVTVDGTPLLAPGNPGAADVTLAIDSTRDVHPISPWIYGYNAGDFTQAPAGVTYLRQGGNRWTAYNWETNASNAGSDWNYSNDAFLSSSTTPAAPLRQTLASAHGRAQGGVLATIPTQGWVSADESGAVNLSLPLDAHFLRTAARKSVTSPVADLTDRMTYADEYAATLASLYTSDAAHPLHLELDNEPDLWANTHAEIEKSKVTYAELWRKSLSTAAALKAAAPGSLIFGPVSYGMNGFVNLQNATDAVAGQWFLQWYLAQAKTASDALGTRVLDVLDVHWYSEATGGGVRVTTDSNNTAAVQAARVQAPRSLWDPTYVETSWITSYLGGAIQLVPRFNQQIAAAFPGSLIAFTEYNHGGEADISGAVAQADVLGIFGAYGVYAATYWPLQGDVHMANGAFEAFRNYDGAGARFADTSIHAASSDVSRVAVYASEESAGRIVIVAINRSATALNAALTLTHTQKLATLKSWQLTATSPTVAGASMPVAQPASTLSLTNAALVALPAMSVSVLELTP